MALHSVSIRNFQSLHDVSLDLAPFTVIVGRSSSGKSAFVRALHTLVHNRRGLDFLTHGQRTCTITARNSHSTITLSRGKGTADDYYEVIPTTPADAPPQRWTKLGGTIPEEVSAALGISPDSDSFASQHDMPYLLSPKQYSPSTVASILGKLTNVSVIFDAARESKRQALDASKTLRLRSTDLESARSSLDRFEHLDEQQHALTEAEKKISAAVRAQRQLNDIGQARAALITAGTTLKRLSTAADITIPDISPLVQAQQRLAALRTAREALITAATTHRELQQRLSTLADEQYVLDVEWQNMRDNTENIFRERFQQHADGSDPSTIHTDTAATIAAKTVEDMSA